MMYALAVEPTLRQRVPVHVGTDEGDASEGETPVGVGYALGQLWRAIRRGEDGTAALRKWRDVTARMASGQVRVGGRRPVAALPLWATLEVAHGGFATGRALAGGALEDFEIA